MANINPNQTCANFCTWLLANSNIRLTAARKIQVQTIQAAANNNTTVTQLYYEEFVAYTTQWFLQWQQYTTQQPNFPQSATLDTLTNTWLANVTNPAQLTIYAVDAFFKQLRADDNLLFDYLFLFAQDQEANAKISLINPVSYQVTEHGTPIWTSYEGYTGNGSSMYLSTNYIESTDAVNVVLNNSCFGVYTRLVNSNNGQVEIGAFDGTNRSQLQERGTASNIEAYVDGSVNSAMANTNTQGLFVALRKSSTGIVFVINRASGGTTTAASSALTTKTDYILALNNNGTAGSYSSNQIALAFKASGNINQTTFYSAVNLLMTTLGAHY